MGERMDGLMDGRMDERMDERMDGRMDERMIVHIHLVGLRERLVNGLICIFFC